MSQVLAYHVPTKGLNTRQEPTAFSDSFTPGILNMYVEPTKCRKRRGFSKIGESSLPLRGTGMDLIAYIDARGNRHEIALTTTHAYLYDTTNNEWDDITPSEVLTAADSGWTAGTSVTLSHDASVKKEGTASAKLYMTTGHSDGDKLAYEDFSAIDITDRNAIGFWLRSDAALASGSIEVVVSENANGSKTNGVTVVIDKALVVDTWQYFIIATSLSAMNAVVSIGVYANLTIAATTSIYVDDVKAHNVFGGTDSDLWVSTLATDSSEFSNNGGTALIIANGVDDMWYYEGHSGDKFKALVHGSSVASCRVLAEFWNHLMFLNFDDGSRNVKSLVHAAPGDVDDFSGVTAGAYTLTDTIGEILAVRKLGSSLVVYSEKSITIGRYYGGLTIFAFPTLVFEIGVVSANAVWASVDNHFVLGTDQRVYAFYGETHLLPVGEAIEDRLFAELDIEKRSQIVTGFDVGRHKVHFFIPTVDDYAHCSYCLNYKSSELSWERHRFAKTVKGFGSIQASFTWYCDEDPVKDLYCDEVSFYTDESYGQTGYEIASFISDDGYVYQLDEVTGKDDVFGIPCLIDTPDFVLSAEEQYGRWQWFSFQAYSSVVGATVDIRYSDDGGLSWIPLSDSPVSLNQQWTTHRLPVDVVSRRIRFRIVQFSDKDLQVRGLFKATVEPQPARD